MTNFAALERKAKTAIREHELTGWSFKWDRAQKRGGLTSFGTKTITISRIVTALNDEAWFDGVLLHEIAHAICGHAAGHNATWKATLRSIGGDGRRTHSGTVNKGRFEGTCNRCKAQAHRMRKSNLMFTGIHVGCGGQFIWVDTQVGRVIAADAVPAPRARPRRRPTYEWSF